MRHRSHTEGFRGLLLALAMPFQLPSLLFVVLTSALLAVMIGAGWPLIVFAIAGIWLTLVWLTHCALQLIDDVANGEPEPRAASVEMANLVGDPRALLHPLLAVAAGLALYYHPEWPRLPVMALAALLLPASLGACAISGRVTDAFHPGELARVVRGLGRWYLPLALFVFACAMLATLLPRWIPWLMLAIALIEMLVLLVYAGIGGALFVRRHELGFEPRSSPERADAAQHAQQLAEQQRQIDSLYNDLRLREATRALDSATQWLRQPDAIPLPAKVHALLDAGSHWHEPREYPRLLRGLVPVLLGLRQPALALQLAEAGLRIWPEFAPQDETDTTALVSYALHTGRRREAARLLGNYLQRSGNAPPSAALQALRTRIQDETGSRTPD